MINWEDWLVQELQKLWKLHAKLLAENRNAEPTTNKKITRAYDLKTGQLVLVKNHHKGPFNPTYIYDHRMAEIRNDSMVLLTTPDGKEKKCNIHHVKPVSSLEVYIGSQVKSPQVHFPNSGTASFRPPVMREVQASHSICTTYDQNKEPVSINIYSHVTILLVKIQ